MTLTDWGRQRLASMRLALEDEYCPKVRDQLEREIVYLQQLDSPDIPASANHEIPWSDSTAILDETEKE